MLSYLVELTKTTFVNPKAGASAVLKLRPGDRTIVELLVLSVALGTLVVLPFGYSSSTPAEDPSVVNGDVETAPELAFLTMMIENPVLFAAFQGLLLCATAGAACFIGRMVGGTGSLRQAFLLMIWLQFIMVFMNTIQIGVGYFLPIVGNLVATATFVIYCWLFVNFVTVLHGFRSVLKVFMGTVVSVFVLAFAVITTVVTLLSL